MDDVLERLLRQAYLFDDPRAYEAGVRDALAALLQGDATPRSAAAEVRAA